MKAMTGDQILIDSQKAGQPPRQGEILEVLEAAFGTRYRVRWEDGHESTIHPMGGTARIRRAGRRSKEWVYPEHGA